MKKMLLSIAVILAGGMFSFSGNTISAQKVKQHKVERVKAAETNGNMAYLPCHEEYYVYDAEWTLSSTTQNTYNENMQKVESVTEGIEWGMYLGSKDVYKYDERGNIIENITSSRDVESDPWYDYMRYTRTYDETRVNVPIRETWYWSDGVDWYIDNSDGLYIETERDDQNRVLKATKWRCEDKGEVLVVADYKYGEDGTVNEIILDRANRKGKLIPYIWSDITWHKTDGQFIVYDNHKAKTIFESDANNMFKSGKLYNRNEDGTKGDLAFEMEKTYDDQDRILTFAYTDAIEKQKIVYTYQYDIDENGSFLKIEDTYSDVDANGIYDESEIITKKKTTTTYDFYGSVIKKETTETDLDLNEDFIINGRTYDRTYDENGAMTEVVISLYDEGILEYTPTDKLVYSEFVSVPTSISNVNKGNADVTINGNTLYFTNAMGAVYTVCDIQGKVYAEGIVSNNKLTIDNMPEGLYIVSLEGRNIKTSIKFVNR